MTPPTGRRYPDVSARARVLAVLRVAEGPLETGELTRRCGLPVARPSQRVYAELRTLEAAGRVARLRRTLGGPDGRRAAGVAVGAGRFGGGGLRATRTGRMIASRYSHGGRA